MLLDAEAKVARLGEVLALELVLLDLEAALEDLLGLGPADGDVRGDLLVTPDPELAHGVPRLGRHWGLPGELLQHLRRPRQTIAGFADGDVCCVSFVRSRELGVGYEDMLRMGRDGQTSKKERDALMTSLSIRSSFMGFEGAVFCSA